MHCTVCGGVKNALVFEGEAKVYQCADCTHVFSDPRSITHPEDYGPEYYERTHRNWFANPDFGLFSWIVGQFPASVRSVLDAGCGKGAFLRYLRDRSQRPLKLVGIDLTVNAPEPGIEYRQGEIAQAVGADRFDAIVTLAVIEHVENPVAFAHLLASHCNPSGVLVTMTLDDDSLLYRVARLMARLKLRGPAVRLYAAHHLQHFTTSSLRRLLERAGLEVVSICRHNLPLKAVDLPESNALARFLFCVGTVGLFWLGRVTGKTYLQTIVARPRG